MAEKIQILSNTNYSLSNVLKGEIMESVEVKIAVAFVRKTGIDEIYKSLDYAMKENNAKIELIAGLDFKTTDVAALFALKDIEKKHKNFSFYCFGDKRDNHNDLIFHPKIYLFDTMLSKQTKYTSIIGSSNLTGGGLSSNFEVNTIFREDKPKYYSQLNAIYNEIKYTDSVFNPSIDYIHCYGNIKKKIEQTENKTGKSVQSDLFELKQQEDNLPGTVPSIKKLIIDIIKEEHKNGATEVSLETIYAAIQKMLPVYKKTMKMDTLLNSIRGELNTNEENSKHKRNLNLFRRTRRSFYTLAPNGENYTGR
jgi:HKD family nuclease